MAHNQVATYSDKPITDGQKSKEFEEHSKTYAGFVFITKWSVITLVVILVLLYLFLVH
ncbi:MAG TPA: aa3-type cytochrome c oxidase subunit IV [Pelagibacterium sp.]|uniref:aa3-type cytochrome c oxidase subunit IV n=1 Tax=Pelagibacterium sp. TaxID=1967288 RepID=UPI002B6D3D17|nr:aa3-type cytochrome c oxidase subunit IV [Pelagibacterium sp.]HWJ87038.1 aa3-type cytochrome c oxidase subunit IV [Pelagibacterium sp.]